MRRIQRPRPLLPAAHREPRLLRAQVAHRAEVLGRVHDHLVRTGGEDNGVKIIHRAIDLGVAMAGWAGLLVTALNLFPIGQLDGGHILYALLRRRAHGIATVLLVAAIVATVKFELYGWSLMLALLVLMSGAPPQVDT